MGVSMSMEKLWAITQGVNRRFPNGNHPFQIMARLLEESGELAQIVNHFEGTGIKWEKYGQPDKAKLAKEIMDVLRCALQAAIFYGVQQELETTIHDSYEKMRAEGIIQDTGVQDNTGPKDDTTHA
jgi:NTP pyrophosphatase (non-canonical NTP hydrolase)